MRVTKRQLRRIVQEAVQGRGMAGVRNLANHLTKALLAADRNQHVHPDIARAMDEIETILRYVDDVAAGRR